MLIFRFQIIAIKLFSVLPSEMCDERTASMLSAFNVAKRNGQNPANLINMAKLQEEIWSWISWIRALCDIGTPKAPKSTSVHLPAPTLQDLLNPVSPNEEPELLIADPYGVQALGTEEDGEKDCPVIICHSDLIRLEIEDLIDLQNTKLQSRFMEDPIAKPTMSTLHAHPTTAAPRNFTDEDWSKDDFLF